MIPKGDKVKILHLYISHENKLELQWLVKQYIFQTSRSSLTVKSKGRKQNVTRIFTRYIIKSYGNI